MNDWLAHLKAKGRKDSTLTTTRHRLLAILRLTESDHILTDLTPRRAGELYAARCAETKPNTHQAELSLAKAWAGWCVKQGWLAANPWMAIEPEGVKAAGGDVLRVGEARRLLDAALGENTPAGLAVALALLTGARASEITDRTARDVDDEGRLLWITAAKTKAGVRQLEIPAAVAPLLQAQAAGKAPDEPLWGTSVTRHWLGWHVRRLCAAAGVPVVSPHDLRRTHATLARRSGIAAETVARELGQNGAAVLRRHYLAPGADQHVATEAVGRMLVTPAGVVTPVVPEHGSNSGDKPGSDSGEQGGETEIPRSPLGPAN